MFIADAQTKGKDCLNNKWSSPKGNLYMTLLFQLNIKSVDILQMIVTSAVFNILQQIVKLHGLNQQQQQLQTELFKIKWVNDIFVRNKKICGVLIKIQQVGLNAYAQVGIGINLNISPLQTSTCLKNILKKEIPDQMIDLISKNLVQSIMIALKKNNQDIVSQYAKKLLYLNQKVVILDISLTNVLFVGRFLGIDKMDMLNQKEFNSQYQTEE